jgi:hypothetical protein
MDTLWGCPRSRRSIQSLTESELAGADDAMPQMMWTRYFIEAQGFKVEECILNQDNLSAAGEER